MTVKETRAEARIRAALEQYIRFGGPNDPIIRMFVDKVSKALAER